MASALDLINSQNEHYNLVVAVNKDEFPVKSWGNSSSLIATSLCSDTVSQLYSRQNSPVFYTRFSIVVNTVTASRLVLLQVYILYSCLDKLIPPEELTTAKQAVAVFHTY